MSDERPPERGDSLPTFVWALLGLLVIAAFVLLLGVLNPVG